MTSLFHIYNVCLMKGKADTLQHATLYYNQSQTVYTNTEGKVLLLWCMFQDDYDYIMVYIFFFFLAKQQQGAQLVTAGGQNLAYNVVQPMQTVTVDGQEALFIPAMPAGQHQAVQLAGGQALITPAGQIIRAPGVYPASVLQNVGGQTVQMPNGTYGEQDRPSCKQVTVPRVSRLVSLEPCRWLSVYFSVSLAFVNGIIQYGDWILCSGDCCIVRCAFVSFPRTV